MVATVLRNRVSQHSVILGLLDPIHTSLRLKLRRETEILGKVSSVVGTAEARYQIIFAVRDFLKQEKENGQVRKA